MCRRSNGVVSIGAALATIFFFEGSLFPCGYAISSEAFLAHMVIEGRPVITTAAFAGPAFAMRATRSRLLLANVASVILLESLSQLVHVGVADKVDVDIAGLHYKGVARAIKAFRDRA